MRNFFASEKAVDYLVDVTCKPVYFPWEISDSKPQFQLDLGLLEGNPLAGELWIFPFCGSHFVPAELSEALHQAAYRDGLGRSLYMPSHKIGTYTSEMVCVRDLLLLGFSLLFFLVG